MARGQTSPRRVLLITPKPIEIVNPEVGMSNYGVDPATFTSPTSISYIRSYSRFTSVLQIVLNCLTESLVSRSGKCFTKIYLHFVTCLL